MGLRNVEEKADEGLLGVGIPIPLPAKWALTRANKNECCDDVIICGLSFHWAAPTFYSQANSGFSFEEHQSKKVYDLYYLPYASLSIPVVLH